MTPRMSRSIRDDIWALRHRGSNFFAVFMALCVLSLTSLQVCPQTPTGVQCPTAPVQAILKPVKAHCGCVVAFKLVAPKPGDKAFVQCHCAEKKSAERVVFTPPKVDVLVAPAVQVAKCEKLEVREDPTSPLVTEASQIVPPAIRPPSVS